MKSTIISIIAVCHTQALMSMHMSITLEYLIVSGYISCMFPLYYRVFTRCVFYLSYEQMLDRQFFGPAFKKHERSHDADLNCRSY